MIDPTLSSYIATQRAQGYSDTQISQALIAAGWDATTVQQALLPATPRTSKRTYLIAMSFGIVLVGLIIIGSFFVFKKPSSRISLQQNTDKTTQNLSKSTQSPPYLGYIQAVDTSMDHPSYIPKITDLTTFEEIPLSGIQPQADTIALIGRWSPDGIHIPFTISGAANNTNRSTRLYWFNAKNKTVSPGPTSDENKLIDYNVLSFFDWFDPTHIMVNLTPSRDFKDLTLQLLSLQNQFTTQTLPYISSKQKNQDMTFSFYRGDGAPGGSSGSQNVTLTNGTVIPLANGDVPIGLISNYLITFNKADSTFNPFDTQTNPEEYERVYAEMEQLKTNGVSEEEISKVLQKELMAKEDSTLTFTPIDTSKEKLVVPIPSDGMETLDIALHPNKKWLIAYQNSPDKERYIRLDISQSVQAPVIDILIERDVVNTEQQLSNLMYESHVFSITDDGDYLITIISNVDILSGGTIFAYNFETKVNKQICDNCQYPRVYNSTLLRSVY